MAENDLDMQAVEDERIGRFHRVIERQMVEECDEGDYYEWKALAHHQTLQFVYINDHIMTDIDNPDQSVLCDFCGRAIDGTLDLDSYRRYLYYHCKDCHTDYCQSCVRHERMDPRTDTSLLDHCLQNHNVSEKVVAMPQLKCKDCKSMLTRDIFCNPESPEKDALCAICYYTKLAPEARRRYVRCKYTNEWDQLKFGSLLDWVPVVRYMDHDFHAIRYISMNANRESDNFGKFVAILVNLPGKDDCMFEPSIATYEIGDIDAALRIMEEDRPLYDYPVVISVMSARNVFYQNEGPIPRPHPDQVVHNNRKDHIRDLLIKQGHPVYRSHMTDLFETRL